PDRPPPLPQSVTARRLAAEHRHELLGARLPALGASGGLLLEPVVIADRHAQLEALPAVLALELVHRHWPHLLLHIIATPPYNLGGVLTYTPMADAPKRPTAGLVIWWRDGAQVCSAGRAKSRCLQPDGEVDPPRRGSARSGTERRGILRGTPRGQR